MNTTPSTRQWLTALIGIWLFVLFMRLVPVGGTWKDLSWITVVGLGMWMFAYAVGFAATGLLAGRRQRSFSPRDDDANWQHRCILGLSTLAALGAALITYEFAFIRGYGFDTPVAMIRINEVDGAMSGSGGGGSAVSGLGRLLTPMLFVAWCLLGATWGRHRGRERSAVVVATLAVMTQQAMFEGGRFFLAALIGVALIAIRSSRRRTAPLPRVHRRTHRMALAAVMATAMLGFGWIFIDRANAFELDLVSVYAIFTEPYAVALPREIELRLSGDAGPIWFVLAMFWMYVTQGANELDAVLNLLQFTHAGGMYQFPQLGQIVSKVFGINIGFDYFTQLPNPGTYLTMFGAAWVDFGMTGAVLQAALLGALTCRALQDLQRGHMNGWALSAPLLLCVGLFAPIVSLLTNLWPAIVAAWAVGATAPRPRIARRPSAVPRAEAAP